MQHGFQCGGNNPEPRVHTSVATGSSIVPQENTVPQDNQDNAAVPSKGSDIVLPDAENIPVGEDKNEHIDMPVDGGNDADLEPPTPMVSAPEPQRRRHTRRKPDSSRLNQSVAPEAKRSKLTEEDYWVDNFLAERTGSYVQKQNKIGRTS